MTRLIDPDESIVAHLNGADWLVLLAGIVVFFAVTFVSSDENALAVAVTCGVLGELVVLKWRSRHDPRMWALVGLVAAIQIPALFLVHLPRIPVSLICLPFAVFEGLALWGLLNWIERHFPRSGHSRTGAGS